MHSVSFANSPKERPGDPSKYSSDPGRGRSGDVANQYLHPDGRGYQKFTQYSGVRSGVDLGIAGVRSGRSDPWTQDTAAEVIGRGDPCTQYSERDSDVAAGTNRISSTKLMTV